MSNQQKPPTHPLTDTFWRTWCHGFKWEVAAVKLLDFTRLLEEKLTEAKSEASHPRIYTRCPSCHNDTLTINKGHLLCTWHECKDPTLIDRVDQQINLDIPEIRRQYQEDLEVINSALDELRTDLKMCTKALALISKGIGSNHAAVMAFEALDNPRIQSILNEK